MHLVSEGLCCERRLRHLDVALPGCRHLVVHALVCARLGFDAGVVALA